ncbi:CCA tRNA nucleotidyltransferase [[Phormidium] sp. ETS-05]|uniref:CCA tRNA nucleotidyltransferase n=1 Tax=[Phormidium] sp. ETS-05 TaxID=222819 RepID=UPI0018EED2B4|nr:CCA tRNA nucleotidyltransferase [[Phormidium] sp. ETS-05]
MHILAPETWPFALEWVPEDAWLVGGAVRDALLNRKSQTLDFDFVLPAGAIEAARRMAQYYRVGFVVLDAERKIARVVFDWGTVDFAKQEGASLTTDLQRRDYRMNAIAYNPRNREFADPLQGREDIQKRLIRMVSPTNLADDPLRLLRAYRQAAQLGFTIDPHTQGAIRQLAPMLAKVAAERVRTELGYILESDNGAPMVQAAGEDGLLNSWFPTATSKNWPLVVNIDTAAAQLAEIYPPLGAELHRDLSSELKIPGYLPIAKLACLVSPHPKTAEAELQRLKYSRAEITAVLRLLRALPETGFLRDISIREQYFLFQEVGPMFPAFAAIAVANGIPGSSLAELMTRYLNPKDAVAHPVALVTGQELMAALPVPRGPQIGRLLEEINIAVGEGKIATPQEALKFAAQLLDIVG